jgi:hypothetical protein
MKIKFLRYDRYLCPKCDEMKHKTLTNKLNQHQELVQNQSTYFKHLLDSLSSKQCLIVQDYTTIHEDSKNKIRVLNITIYTKSTTLPFSQLNVRYLDFIGHIKANYQITNYVWSLLVEKLYLPQYIEGIFIWSDNGFKNKMNIYYFLNLQQKLQTQIQCHYFAAYHGHSICDRHFGVAKRKLRIINRTTLVHSIEQVDAAFASISNTSTYLIDVDQELLPKVPKHFQFEDQIRKFHEWQFTADKKIMSREQSGKGDFIEQIISCSELEDE